MVLPLIMMGVGQVANAGKWIAKKVAINAATSVAENVAKRGLNYLLSDSDPNRINLEGVTSFNRRDVLENQRKFLFEYTKGDKIQTKIERRKTFATTAADVHNNAEILRTEMKKFDDSLKAIISELGSSSSAINSVKLANAVVEAYQQMIISLGCKFWGTDGFYQYQDLKLSDEQLTEICSSLRTTGDKPVDFKMIIEKIKTVSKGERGNRTPKATEGSPALSNEPGVLLLANGELKDLNQNKLVKETLLENRWNYIEDMLNMESSLSKLQEEETRDKLFNYYMYGVVRLPKTKKLLEGGDDTETVQQQNDTEVKKAVQETIAFFDSIKSTAVRELLLSAPIRKNPWIDTGAKTAVPKIFSIYDKYLSDTQRLVMELVFRESSKADIAEYFKSYTTRSIVDILGEPFDRLSGPTNKTFTEEVEYIRRQHEGRKELVFTLDHIRGFQNELEYSVTDNFKSKLKSSERLEKFNNQQQAIAVFGNKIALRNYYTNKFIQSLGGADSALGSLHSSDFVQAKLQKKTMANYNALQDLSALVAFNNNGKDFEECTKRYNELVGLQQQHIDSLQQQTRSLFKQYQAMHTMFKNINFLGALFNQFYCYAPMNKDANKIERFFNDTEHGLIKVCPAFSQLEQNEKEEQKKFLKLILNDVSLKKILDWQADEASKNLKFTISDDKDSSIYRDDEMSGVIIIKINNSEYALNPLNNTSGAGDISLASLLNSYHLHKTDKRNKDGKIILDKTTELTQLDLLLVVSQLSAQVGTKDLESSLQRLNSANRQLKEQKEELSTKQRRISAAINALRKNQDSTVVNIDTVINNLLKQIKDGTYKDRSTLELSHIFSKINFAEKEENKSMVLTIACSILNHIGIGENGVDLHALANESASRRLEELVNAINDYVDKTKSLDGMIMKHLDTFVDELVVYQSTRQRYASLVENAKFVALEKADVLETILNQASKNAQLLATITEQPKSYTDRLLTILGHNRESSTVVRQLAPTVYFAMAAEGFSEAFRIADPETRKNIAMFVLILNQAAAKNPAQNNFSLLTEEQIFKMFNDLQNNYAEISRKEVTEEEVNKGLGLLEVVKQKIKMHPEVDLTNFNNSPINVYGLSFGSPATANATVRHIGLYNQAVASTVTANAESANQEPKSVKVAVVKANQRKKPEPGIYPLKLNEKTTVYMQITSYDDNGQLLIRKPQPLSSSVPALQPEVLTAPVISSPAPAAPAAQAATVTPVTPVTPVTVTPVTVTPVTVTPVTVTPVTVTPAQASSVAPAPAPAPQESSQTGDEKTYAQWLEEFDGLHFPLSDDEINDLATNLSGTLENLGLTLGVFGLNAAVAHFDKVKELIISISNAAFADVNTKLNNVIKNNQAKLTGKIEQVSTDIKAAYKVEISRIRNEINVLEKKKDELTKLFEQNGTSTNVTEEIESHLQEKIDELNLKLKQKENEKDQVVLNSSAESLNNLVQSAIVRACFHILTDYLNKPGELAELVADESKLVAKINPLLSEKFDSIDQITSWVKSVFSYDIYGLRNEIDSMALDAFSGALKSNKKAQQERKKRLEEELVSKLDNVGGFTKTAIEYGNTKVPVYKLNQEQKNNGSNEFYQIKGDFKYKVVNLNAAGSSSNTTKGQPADQNWGLLSKDVLDVLADAEEQILQQKKLAAQTAMNYLSHLISNLNFSIQDLLDISLPLPPRADGVAGGDDNSNVGVKTQENHNGGISVNITSKSSKESSEVSAGKETDITVTYQNSDSSMKVSEIINQLKQKEGSKYSDTYTGFPAIDDVTKQIEVLKNEINKLSGTLKELNNETTIEWFESSNNFVMRPINIPDDCDYEEWLENINNGITNIEKQRKELEDLKGSAANSLTNLQRKDLSESAQERLMEVDYLFADSTVSVPIIAKSEDVPNFPNNRISDSYILKEGEQYVQVYRIRNCGGNSNDTQPFIEHIIPLVKRENFTATAGSTQEQLLEMFENFCPVSMLKIFEVVQKKIDSSKNKTMNNKTELVTVTADELAAFMMAKVFSSAFSGAKDETKFKVIEQVNLHYKTEGLANTFDKWLGIYNGLAQNLNELNSFGANNTDNTSELFTLCKKYALSYFNAEASIPLQQQVKSKILATVGKYVQDLGGQDGGDASELASEIRMAGEHLREETFKSSATIDSALSDHTQDGAFVSNQGAVAHSIVNSSPINPGPSQIPAHSISRPSNLTMGEGNISSTTAATLSDEGIKQSRSEAFKNAKRNSSKIGGGENHIHRTIVNLSFESKLSSLNKSTGELSEDPEVLALFLENPAKIDQKLMGQAFDFSETNLSTKLENKHLQVAYKNYLTGNFGKYSLAFFALYSLTDGKTRSFGYVEQSMNDASYINLISQDDWVNAASKCDTRDGLIVLLQMIFGGIISYKEIEMLVATDKPIDFYSAMDSFARVVGWMTVKIPSNQRVSQPGPAPKVDSAKSTDRELSLHLKFLNTINQTENRGVNNISLLNEQRAAYFLLQLSFYCHFLRCKVNGSLLNNQELRNSYNNGKMIAGIDKILGVGDSKKTNSRQSQQRKSDWFIKLTSWVDLRRILEFSVVGLPPYSEGTEQHSQSTTPAAVDVPPPPAYLATSAATSAATSSHQSAVSTDASNKTWVNAQKSNSNNHQTGGVQDFYRVTTTSATNRLGNNGASTSVQSLQRPSAPKNIPTSRSTIASNSDTFNNSDSNGETERPLFELELELK